MAITLVDTSHSELDANNAVPGFSGTQAGDVALAWVYYGTDSPALVPPSGWVLVTESGGSPWTVGVKLYRKVLTSSEPSSYDFGPSFLGTHISAGAWRGVDLDTPVEAYASAEYFDVSDPVTTWDIPSVTTLTDGAVCAAGLSHSSAVGTFNEETSVEDYELVSTGSNNWLPIYVLEMPTAGATGAKTVVMEDEVAYYFPIVAVLRPAGGGSNPGAAGNRSFCSALDHLLL